MASCIVRLRDSFSGTVSVGDFKELKVWQRSRDVVLAVYAATTGFPPCEQEGLALQLRRAATSISSNIAESRGQFTAKDQMRFLRMAQGSAREVECEVMLARDLGLLQRQPADELLSLVAEVQRMLSALMRASRTHPTPNTGSR